jgi:hypothetical protein
MKNIFRFTCYNALPLYLTCALLLLSCTGSPVKESAAKPNPITKELAAQYAPYAMMAVNAYHDNSNFPIDLLGWQLVDKKGNPTKQPTHEDYSGLAFDIWENKSEYAVVFAFRGTEKSDPRDIYCATVGKFTCLQYFKASTFFKEWISDDANKNKKITLTGHSLGGALALYLSNEYKKADINAIVFDSLPSPYYPNKCNVNKAKRVLIYEEGEFVAGGRNTTEYCRDLILKENIYLTNFISSKWVFGKHESYLLCFRIVETRFRNKPRTGKSLQGSNESTRILKNT